MARFAAGALRRLVLVLVPLLLVESRLDPIRLPSDRVAKPIIGEGDPLGTRWAVLIAGSNGYYNYRHQVYRLPLSISHFRLMIFSMEKEGNKNVFSE